ncbi:hypothetical protein [Breoghania sp.]|uniref:hypothetical protein n=1 Tax=Breoghania sp. TaxID=2065378 RepID=UPI002AAAD285|nr:hypothetical protein [Breoghania sp.]
MEDLEIAKKALRKHYEAVSIVLDDPAPSKELKESLCGFSEAITDREFGMFLIQMVRDDVFSDKKIGAEAKKIHSERSDLARKYDHLNKAFHSAIETGVVALVLRWPETSRYFRQISLQMASDERRETQIAQKAASFLKDRGRNNDRDDGNHGGAGTPLAMPA